MTDGRVCSREGRTNQTNKRQACMHACCILLGASFTEFCPLNVSAVSAAYSASHTSEPDGIGMWPQGQKKL